MGRPLSTEKRIDKFFSYRPRSIHETEVYLEHKIKLSKEAVANYIAKLKRGGLLDDEVFAMWWVEQRTRARHRSLYLIARELASKGVDKELVANVIAKSPVNDMETVRVLLAKKMSIFERKYNAKNLVPKIISYLQRRGYSYTISKNAIEDYRKSE